MSEPNESDLKTAREITEGWTGVELLSADGSRRIVMAGRVVEDVTARIALALAARGDEERARAAKAMCGYCQDPATWGVAVQNPGPTWNHGERYCAATPIKAAAIRDGGRDGK